MNASNIIYYDPAIVDRDVRPPCYFYEVVYMDGYDEKRMQGVCYEWNIAYDNEDGSPATANEEDFLRHISSIVGETMDDAVLLVLTFPEALNPKTWVKLHTTFLIAKGSYVPEC
jgi:hypothetical protein